MPPIIEDDDDMVFVAAEVVVGTPAERKRKRDQPSWNYSDETGSGGKGWSDDEIVIGAEEWKRSTLTGHGGTIVRRGSLEEG